MSLRVKRKGGREGGRKDVLGQDTEALRAVPFPKEGENPEHRLLFVEVSAIHLVLQGAGEGGREEPSTPKRASHSRKE